MIVGDRRGPLHQHRQGRMLAGMIMALHGFVRRSERPRPPLSIDERGHTVQEGVVWRLSTLNAMEDACGQPRQD